MAPTNTANLLAQAQVPAFKCPPGTKMHFLDLGTLQADEGWYVSPLMKKHLRGRHPSILNTCCLLALFTCEHVAFHEGLQTPAQALILSNQAPPRSEWQHPERQESREQATRLDRLGRLDRVSWSGMYSVRNRLRRGLTSRMQPSDLTK